MSQSSIGKISRLSNLRKGSERVRLQRENQILAEQIQHLEKDKLTFEQSLKESQDDCDYFKQIAIKAEDITTSEYQLSEEVKRLHSENVQIFMENKTLTERNYDLTGQTKILEGEIERLNHILFQMENKILEVTNEKYQALEEIKRLNKINKEITELLESKTKGFYYKDEEMPYKTFDCTEKDLEGSINQSQNMLRKAQTFNVRFREEPNETYMVEDHVRGNTSRRKLSQTHIDNMKKLANLSMSAKNTDEHFVFQSPQRASSRNTARRSSSPVRNECEKRQNNSSPNRGKIKNLDELKRLIKQTQQSKKSFK
ncbi:hypothetical protein SteCoe_3056 [Stentor coeruleus]|uniref:Uncharacterized protein n=1 Tax=Stentor coeruleus TaxID=5963 RepID=A0A1R2CXY5_9CILI|nr:hypothetical protein SteCoe_3056 [Stentor coeruleus]